MEDRPTTPRRRSSSNNVDYELIEAMFNRAIQQVIEQHGERAARIEEMLEKHEHLLYGNGKEGLTTKIDRIERAVSKMTGLGWRIVEVLVISGVVGVLILLVQNNLLKP